MMRLQIFLPVSNLDKDKKKAVQSIKSMVASVFHGVEIRWTRAKQNIRGGILLIGRLRRTEGDWATVVVIAGKEDVLSDDPRVEFDGWGIGRFLNWGKPDRCRLQMLPEQPTRKPRKKDKSHDTD